MTPKDIQDQKDANASAAQTAYLNQIAQHQKTNPSLSPNMLKKLTGRLDPPKWRDVVFDFPPSYHHDRDEEQLRLAAIEEILINGSSNMSPRHVAETVLRIATQRMDYRTVNQMVSRHKAGLDPKDFIQWRREEVELERHVAECCEHMCKFNDLECAIVNGTATADMPCEEGDHL